MQKIDLVSRRPMTRSKLQNILEAWAGREGVAVKPMGRLARRYKSEGDDMHWHLTGLRDGMGTVEITYVPSATLLTVLVHEKPTRYMGRSDLQDTRPSTRQANPRNLTWSN
ncbi:MAG TPA: hypothetical protein VFJ63_00440 [Candidatus Bathyarchaeia archaeon]|nr:hypothetical protein [Candidatus Bathyarchaeia archaeon]